MTTKILLSDSLLILDRLTRSDKCLVCDTELQLVMKGGAAPVDFENKMKSSGQLELSTMTVQLLKFVPYFCKAGELDHFPFADCSRREIAQNIKVTVRMD